MLFVSYLPDHSTLPAKEGSKVATRRSSSALMLAAGAEV
jgi:hypothetical protein